MANTSSAKGNPASHRMSNPNNKNRRIKNKVKNELVIKVIDREAIRRHRKEMAAS